MRSRRARRLLPQPLCWMATIVGSRQPASPGHRYFRRVGPTALSALSRAPLGTPEFFLRQDATFHPWQALWLHSVPTFPALPRLTGARAWPRTMERLDTATRN